MAKKSLNESRKSTIQKVVALTAHSMSSEHSASSPEHKSSHGSIRSGVYRFCHGSVDTPIGGVDTGSESLKVFHEDRVKCVDTAPGSVNTSPRFQKTQLPDWGSVSTQPVSVSILVPSPRRPVLCNWDSVSTHSVTVSTHSG
ncbi:hypothetical protein Taro_038327 [Colocasia esculenta]|uniref:Uncharacterized protein n=1 Tax=Colocasia esculenta TaxID=4460 RepID=A0A843WCH1_COLES|nr:hypothetical protein [Colocasia esculenta]